ncbi:hypothetical protein ACH47Z_34080 [Streptomyces sp. NPDC020192]
MARQVVQQREQLPDGRGGAERDQHRERPARSGTPGVPRSGPA